MTTFERRAWTMLVVTVAAYATYVVLLLGRAATAAMPATPYVDLMLATIGAAIVANIVVSILWGIGSGIRLGRAAERVDARDREIHRAGEYTGTAFLVIGALAAMVFAWLRFDPFWIANVIYLGFVLSAVLSSITKVVVYRTGMPAW